jgi:poly-gamma-glutamate synthesis protein (capsule biosynthesis protein)
VPRPRLSALRELARELGLNPPAEGDELTVFRARFRAAEKADVETEPDPEDVAEIAAVVRNASRLADCTVVSIHAHEGDRDVFVPARFLVRFAHAMIDAGADVLVGHGPHVLRGIEVYKGRPILYSLGNFIFENETVLRLPYENYEAYGLGADQHVADFNDRRYDNDRRGFPSRREMWESVIALPRWQGRTLVELRLVPISLGFGRPRQVRGRPLLAEADLARRIIDDLARLSAPFGTRLEYHEGTAVVRLQ